MNLIHPKQFYRNYIADDTFDKVDRFLITIISDFSPASAYEFGCGSGKNLQQLKNQIAFMETCGQDISPMNCLNAHLRGVDSVIIGDERHMPMRKFDVCFTCSVLDHVPPENIEQVVGNLQAMANKAVIIAESVMDDPDNFYWNHDYSAWGFQKVSGDYTTNEGGWIVSVPQFISPDDKSEYFIWIWRKPQE